MDYASKFIGKTVDVKIDRPLNSRHPQYDLIYLVNYGYLENTMAPDGEEIDAYVLGVNSPIAKFKGRCIAVIHRLDDEDDNLIVVPENMRLTDTEIMKSVEFQEKFYKSVIIR